MPPKKNKEVDAPLDPNDHGNVDTVESSEDWRIKLKRSIDIYKPMVVNFVASWCTKCKEMNPQFIHISKKHPSMYFVKVDVDALPDVSAQWGVKAVPSFVFVRGGQQIDLVVGANIDEVDSKAQLYALPPPNPA